MNLLKMTFKMDKNTTSLFYFFLESRDNLCFYSTLAFKKGQQWREVVTYCTPNLIQEFENTISHISKTLEITQTSREIVS